MPRAFTRYLLIVAIALATVSAPAEPLLLQYKYKTGEVDKYKMTLGLNLQMSGMPGSPGPASMKLTMGIPYTQKTLAVYGNGSAAKVKLIYGQPTISGLPAEAKKAKPPKIAGTAVVMTVSNLGQVLSIQSLYSPASGSMPVDPNLSSLMGCSPNAAVLPGVPVEVGQSWNQAVPLPFENSQMSITTALEAYNEEILNWRVARISQNLSGSIDVGALLKQVIGGMGISAGGQAVPDVSSMLGQLSFAGNMVFYFAPSAGKLVRGAGNIQAGMDVRIPADPARKQPGGTLSLRAALTMNLSRLK